MHDESLWPLLKGVCGPAYLSAGLFAACYTLMCFARLRSDTPCRTGRGSYLGRAAGAMFPVSESEFVRGLKKELANSPVVPLFELMLMNDTELRGRFACVRVWQAAALWGVLVDAGLRLALPRGVYWFGTVPIQFLQALAVLLATWLTLRVRTMRVLDLRRAVASDSVSLSRAGWMGLGYLSREIPKAHLLAFLALPSFLWVPADAGAAFWPAAALGLSQASFFVFGMAVAMDAAVWLSLGDGAPRAESGMDA